MNIPMKTKDTRGTVREELERLNIVYVIHRLNKYFNTLHGYERGISGLTAEDFSMTVLEKIVSGERSWEKHKRNDFLGFCFDVMRSEVGNARNSLEYQNTVRLNGYDVGDNIRRERNRWERNGLDDNYNGF
jgi:hypothetical protein